LPADAVSTFYLAAAPLIAGVFGLLFGSFLNVCIYRSQHDLSVLRPARSFCPACRHTIAWYDNLPVLSYLALRGRCRHCAQTIPLRYPVVELSTAILFALIVRFYGVSLPALKWCVLASLLTVLLWTDLEGRVLPDEFTLGGTLLGLMFAAFVPPPAGLLTGLIPDLALRLQWLFASSAAALILVLPLLLVGWLYQLLRGRAGIGLGDIKLLALIGVFLGLESGLAALLIGSITGSVAGLLYIRIRRLNAATYWLPYGSFLCLGALICIFRNGGGEFLLGVR
jgi:leader peptidase (prepilin peptidase) / N-methyltransferase